MPNSTVAAPEHSSPRAFDDHAIPPHEAVKTTTTVASSLSSYTHLTEQSTASPFTTSRSNITMADQLLDQIRDIAEGQIVSRR